MRGSWLTPAGAAAGIAPPQEPVRLDRGEHAVELAVAHEATAPSIQRPRIDERRRRLQEHDDPTSTPRASSASSACSSALSELAVSPASVGGPRDDLGAPLLGDRGDLVVVGRDDDPVDGCRGAGRGDRAGDERHAADAPQVLARHALRPAAGGDDRDDLAHAATLLPSASDRRAAASDHAAGALEHERQRGRGATSGSVSISSGSVAPASTSSAGSVAPRDRARPGSRRPRSSCAAVSRRCGR